MESKTLRKSITGFVAENWGIFFIAYALVLLVVAAIIYATTPKAYPMNDVVFYANISAFIGAILQTLSTLFTSRMYSSIWSFVSTNLGFFFWVYSIILLLVSLISYLQADLALFSSFTFYGLLSVPISFTIQILGREIKEKGFRFTTLSHAIISIITVIASSSMLYWVMLKIPKLTPFSRLMVPTLYAFMILAAYVFTFNFTKSTLTGLVAGLLVTFHPSLMYFTKLGNYAIFLLSASYLLLAYLLLYEEKMSALKVGMISFIILLQVLFKADMLWVSGMVIMLAPLIKIISGKRIEYVLYASSGLACVVTSYMLSNFPKNIKMLFDILDPQLLIILLITLVISIGFLMYTKDYENLKPILVFPPLIVTIWIKPEYIYMILVTTSLCIAALNVKLLKDAFRFNLINETVDLEVDMLKLLFSLPFVAMFILSVIKVFG